MNMLKNHWDRCCLALILALAAFLTFWGARDSGWSNWYYAAAVQSMLTSWHNFFFASFDPGGFITVDKPALGLWLQTASAWIFGLHGWSMILVESLCTVISVAVLYHLVQRSFGPAAGLISALMLALTPILVAVSRTNNLDASLIMTLLLAVWALLAAAERNSLKHLLLAMALVGIGYNIKMLAAFMVLPAFYAVYLFGASLTVPRRLIHLALATAVLAAVSLSWSVIVDLTPADARPYIGSSSTNSVIELALGYNGLQRVLPTAGPGGMNRPQRGNDGTDGVQTGPGGPAGQPGQNGPPDNKESAADSSIPAANNTGSNDPAASNISDSSNTIAVPAQAGPATQQAQAGPATQQAQEGFSGRNGGPAGGPRGMTGGTTGPGLWGGEQGVFRLFNRDLGSQICWFIPLAMLGGIFAFMRLRGKEGQERSDSFRNLLLWSMWVLPMLVYFSIAGFFHPYYSSLLGPGIAALAGIGLVEMGCAFKEHKNWQAWALPAVLLINAAVQVVVLARYDGWPLLLIPAVLGLSLAGVLALAHAQRSGKDRILTLKTRSWASIALAALLISPAAWSCTPLAFGFANTTLPYSGPDLALQPEWGIVTYAKDSDYQRLADFLVSHYNGEKYLLATGNSRIAAYLMLETGHAVIASGGFNGNDGALSPEQLAAMTETGEIRYALLENGNGGGNDLAQWIKSHGTAIILPEDQAISGENEIDDLIDGYDSKFTVYELDS